MVWAGARVRRPQIGEVLADFVAERIGSWPFVLWQSAILLAWLVLNSAAVFDFIQWDKYPYILLNLMLSFQAAYTGPILLIAQRRKERMDERRIKAMEHHLHEARDTLKLVQRNQSAILQALKVPNEA